MTGFQLSCRANASDRLLLTADNSDLALFGHPALQHGTTVDVRWGYHGAMGPARRMYLEEFRGFAELELVFSGRERPLNQQAKVRAWTDSMVAEAVAAVAAENGFTGAYLHMDTPPTADKQTINQAGETDAALLQRLAAQVGYAFYLDEEGLHWRDPKNCQSSMMILDYSSMSSGITEINFTSNLARHVGRVAVRTRDPLERQTVTAQANAETATRATLASTIEIIDPDNYATAMQSSNATATVHPSGAVTAEAAQAEATARFVGAEATALEARIAMVGCPLLLPRRLIRLEGVSTFLTGTYFIQEAEHRIGPGYTTRLNLTRDGGGPRQGVAVAPQGGPAASTPTAPAEAIEIIDPQLYEENAH